MFIARRLNPTTGAVELWRCEWENQMGAAAKKVFLEMVAVEKKASDDIADPAAEAPAICWSYGRTLGNIAVFSQSMIGRFPSTAGNDASLPCDFVEAGKARNGAERWWCRTHQTHWGTKADQAAFEQFGEMRCANHTQLMSYVVGPPTIDLSAGAEVGIWCSMPPALSTHQIGDRPPKIHVHVRPVEGEPKTIDGDFAAVSVLYSAAQDLFDNKDITRVNVTPPAAFEFVCALEQGRPLSCVNCSNCGYPHLDLGDFARKPHVKHFCGNCGRDSTWSKEPIVSTPLKPLHDSFADSLKYETPNRNLNLDNHKDCTYTIWASTPAVIWTAKRPQEFGIHVHVHKDGKRIIDDTFGEVVLQGHKLERAALLEAMIARTKT